MRLRKTAVVAAVVLTAAVLAGCAPSAEPPVTPAASSSAEPSAEVSGAAQQLLAANGLDGLDGQEIVDRLDRVAVADRAEFVASVRPGELLVGTSQEDATAVPLPEDEFYLSIAPYVDTMHECFYHSLTTCHGEIHGEQVTVTVVDDAGEVLIDEQRTTFDNGFVGLWLPRDISGTLTVEYDGLSVSTPIATGDDDPTCLTALKLA